MSTLEVPPETTHLMTWHRRDDPSALRLTAVLKQVDQFLFCVANDKLRRYEIWRKSPSGSTTLCMRIEGDNGEYIDPNKFANRAMEKLRAMETPADKLIRGIQEHNDKVRNDAWKAATDEVEASSEYYRKRIGQEEDGHAPRFTTEDAMAGYKERWV